VYRNGSCWILSVGRNANAAVAQLVQRLATDRTTEGSGFESLIFTSSYHLTGSGVHPASYSVGDRGLLYGRGGGKFVE
jgi:hypothetical protein